MPTTTYLFLFLTCSSFAVKLEVQHDAENSDVAKHQLQKIYKQTQHMKYGQCWTEALEVLQLGCRQLDDETQRRIAYSFARCHLQSAGRDIPRCESYQPVIECTSNEVLQDVAFNTYTEFFTHTQSICFHLQNQVWHESTENTISRLAENSADVANNLEESSRKTQKLLHQQNASLLKQEEIFRNEEIIRQKLQDSVSGLQLRMEYSVASLQSQHEHTKSIIAEQRNMFVEVYDRVAILQKTFLGQFTTVYSCAFYLFSTILSYMLTATQRTSSARIWLYALLMLNFATEKLIANFQLENSYSSEGVHEMVLPEALNDDIWMCRKCFLALAVLTLLICVYRFKDYSKINNQLLQSIQEQNMELRQYIKLHMSKDGGAPQSNGGAGGGDPVHNDTNTTVVASSCNALAIITSSQSDSPPSSADDTVASDCTYVPDESSYFTGDSRTSSRNSSFYRASTPLRDDRYMQPDEDYLLRPPTSPYSPTTTEYYSHMTSYTPMTSPTNDTTALDDSMASSASFSQMLQENIEEVNGLMGGRRYNLRNRSRRSTPANNSILQRESVDDFINAVERATANRGEIITRARTPKPRRR